MGRPIVQVKVAGGERTLDDLRVKALGVTRVGTTAAASIITLQMLLVRLVQRNIVRALVAGVVKG
jgi:deoxyribose-phosphate aldolase